MLKSIGMFVLWLLAATVFFATGIWLFLILFFIFGFLFGYYCIFNKEDERKDERSARRDDGSHSKKN